MGSYTTPCMFIPQGDAAKGDTRVLSNYKIRLQKELKIFFFTFLWSIMGNDTIPFISIRK